MMLFAVGVCLNSSMFILQEDKGWEVMNRHVPRAPKYEFSRKKSCLDLGPRWPLLCCLHFASRLSILLCLQTRGSTCSLAWGSLARSLSPPSGDEKSLALRQNVSNVPVHDVCTFHSFISTSIDNLFHHYRIFRMDFRNRQLLSDFP